jgi:hypothetical protein
MNDVQDGEAFAEIDPKLTVFALANGVDLARGEGYRRLEWYSDGFERGIMIAADGDGRYGIALLKWKSGHAGAAEPESFHDAVQRSDLVGLLDDAVEAANAL